MEKIGVRSEKSVGEGLKDGSGHEVEKCKSKEFNPSCYLEKSGFPRMESYAFAGQSEQAVGEAAKGKSGHGKPEVESSGKIDEGKMSC